MNVIKKIQLKKLATIGALALSLAPATSAAKREVNIGAVFPMTGPVATYGQESVNGIKLALKKIEKDGKVKINLKLEDNKSEPQESANAVTKLIKSDSVDAIIGSVASSNTLAGAPIAQTNKVPLLTPASTNEKVTQAGDFVSRTCFTDAFQGVVMAKFAYENLKKRKMAVIIDNSSDYSKGLSKVFKKKYLELGGKLVSEEDFAYIQKDTDFRSLLRKVKRMKPDAIFLPGYYTEVGLILKQARQMGMNMPFLGGDGWDSPTLQKLAGKAVSGNYISSHFAPDDKDPKVQNFVKEYKAEYGQNPGAMAALGYDGILVMAEAIASAKSTKNVDIQRAILATKNFSGVTGNITIGKDRNAEKSAVVLETTPAGNVFNTKVNP